MDPEWRHVADCLCLDLNDAGFACGRFELHQSVSALSVVNFRTISLGMNMTAGKKELVSNAARIHAGNTIDQVTAMAAGLEVLDIVNNRISMRFAQDFKSLFVTIETNKVIQAFFVAASIAAHAARFRIDHARYRFA